jgi:hypothetical protein
MGWRKRRYAKDFQPSISICKRLLSQSVHKIEQSDYENSGGFIVDLERNSEKHWKSWIGTLQLPKQRSIVSFGF